MYQLIMHNLAYHSVFYYLAFLPVVVSVYQLTPTKFRKYILLIANYCFFFSWSKMYMMYQIIVMIISFFTGIILQKLGEKGENADKKKKKNIKKAVLWAAILLNLSVLITLKYTNFFGESLALLTKQTYTAVQWVIPIGISYYTLQHISYLVDVYRGKNSAAKNIVDFAVYASFFPVLVQGPITRYHEVIESLTDGAAITYRNLVLGSQRILFGLMKKMIIADHLSPAVNKIFTSYSHDGLFCLIGAILCTIQLYMDFSGIVDICLGSAEIFGVTLPENFRQPFFAKNANDFWRRWHITLGTFLRDYIFYPISLSKFASSLSKWMSRHCGKNAGKLVGPLIALFVVWLANGLWHGPHWAYIFYGMYYFCVMVIEILLNKPFENFLKRKNISSQSVLIKSFRFIKLFMIVITGELLFRAKTVTLGFTMFLNIFRNFDISTFWGVLPYLRLDSIDWAIVIIGTVIVFVADVYKERGVSIREAINTKKVWICWGLIYACIFAVILFGAHGPGYDIVAMIYAEF